MSKYKIIHERDKCIGCGACAAVCPVNWYMDDDGRSRPRTTDIDDVGCNQEAADGCPTQCIHVEKAGAK